MTSEDDALIEIAAARQREIEARIMAHEAAAGYRRVVAGHVAVWRAAGMSVRACAARIGITEGALRDLLRPDGEPRRSRTPRRGTRSSRDGQGAGTGAGESPPTS